MGYQHKQNIVDLSKTSRDSRISRLIVALLVSGVHAVLIAPSFADTKPGADQSSSAVSAEVARGKYLITIAGCNDCHTPGYAQAGGKVAESTWLTGDRLGYKGPWGTTFAANLRLMLNAMTRAEWIAYARTMQSRPPMPWFSVRAMSDADLGAIWAYVKASGPSGQAMPASLPPGKTPDGPVVQFPE